MNHVRFVVIALSCIGSVVAVSAQAPDASPRFDVTSVKRNTSRDARANVDLTPGRFTATAVTLRELIGVAYSISTRIVGGPGWVDTERFDLGRGHLVAHAVTIRMLVTMLANLPDVGRIVQDRTALDGSFDLELTWTPAAVSREPSDTARPAAPSLFTALEEQAGLKLEPSTGPVDVLVIDSAERPTPD